MAKIVKLKQSDIERIVENVLRENEGFDDFDTKVQPEELSQSSGEEMELSLGQDEEGNYYVMKDDGGETPEILFKTK